jgi:DNA helicase-2/ATP-dependent DNA helicase PcrA
VIVTGMEEGLFPVANASYEQDDLEEERRLCYVAVTRAKEKLFLTNCERRYRFGELSYPTPSRFLNEIRDELLEFRSTAPPKPSSDSYGGFNRSAPAVRKPSRPAFEEQAPAFEPDFDPGHDDYSQTDRTLQIGSMVFHQTFGRGRVEQIVGSGDRAKLTVRFEQAGRKQLMLKFANLRLL